jgi:periplasmic protein TonB
MKKKHIKTGILSMAGGMLMTLFITSCNDTSTTAKKEEVAAKDTTSTAAVTVKKKGKASMGMETANSNAVKVEKDKNGIYTKAEVMPVYPGKDQGLSDYIASNIVYPDQAVENNIEGTVHVEFVVDDKGTISDVKTIGNKLGYGLEEEAVNVVNKLSKWSPGKVKGKNVKTRLTIPITYKLES